MSYSDGTAPVAIAYDADGRRVQMVDATGTSSDVYNPVDELTKTAGQTYRYDPAGNFTRSPLGTFTFALAVCTRLYYS